MKILKKIGIALLALIAIGLVAAAFMPTHFEYERSTDINASKDVIYSILNDMRTWEEWGPWKQEDPTMKVSYGEKTEGVGASYIWTGEKTGNGTITITEATPPTLQKSKIEFEGQGGGDGWFRLEDGDAGATKTSWGFAFDVSWPLNIFVVLSGDGQMNNMFDTGLSGLKTMAEKKAAEQPATGKFKISPVDFPGKTYLGIREKVNFDQTMTADFFATRFGQIAALMGKTKMEADGQPCGVYYTWDEATKTTDMAVAIPVKKGVAVNGGNIKTFEIPAGKAFAIDYYGAYTGTGDAHMAMDEYFAANGMKASVPVIEEYVTDPGAEPDTAKWLTRIYYLVESQMAAEK